MTDEYDAALQHYNYVRSATNDAGQIASAQAAVQSALKRRKPVVNALAAPAPPQGNGLARLTNALTPKRQRP